VNQGNWNDLLHAGVSASSADNSQPWTFRLHGDRMELGLDKTRLGLFFDPGLAASLISCGGLYECIRIAATRFGWQASLHPHGTDNYPHQVAAITIDQAASVSPDPLETGLGLRATHRGHYRRWRKAPPQLLDQAADQVRQVPGHRVIWLTGQARAAATRLVYGADALRFSHQRVHEEFHGKLRLGREAANSQDGLAQDTLGIERLFFPVLKLTAPWPVTSMLNRFGWHYAMAARGAWIPCLSAAGLGALVQERSAGYLEAGRALHRLWIALNQAGLAFQPLGAFPLFLMRLEDLDGEGFSGKQNMQLQRGRQQLPAILECYDLERERLIMLFRFGYPFANAPRARRRPLEDFLDGW
jgi:nitroreductase